MLLALSRSWWILSLSGQHVGWCDDLLDYREEVIAREWLVENPHTALGQDPTHLIKLLPGCSTDNDRDLRCWSVGFEHLQGIQPGPFTTEEPVQDHDVRLVLLNQVR